MQALADAGKRNGNAVFAHIEFKDDMPKTLVGKVAYRALEEEELAKIKTAEQA